MNALKLNKYFGFTLIELLVVISIIALLLSVIIPSLRAAKESSRSAVCMAHLRSVGTGLQLYTMNNESWLAGPNTSGYRNSFGNVNLNDSLGVSTPVQNMDWISPTLGEELGLHNRGYNRLVDIFNTKFCCPSNKKTYDYYYDGAEQPIGPWLQSRNLGVNELKYSSYSAILGFHVWNEPGVVYEAGIPVSLPANYRPKIERIRMPGNKIYVIDGARYVKLNKTLEAPWSSYNDFQYQNDGGNFMLYGPSVAMAGDPFYQLSQYMVLPGKTNLRDAGNMSEIYLGYGFRHKQGLNAAYFDGHCEHMDWMSTTKVNFYFPGGSIVTSAIGTADPDDSNGQIIR